MKKLKLNIPTLSPVLFRDTHIENKSDALLNHDNITQFFIHSLKEDSVTLKLPIPPHKKTVHDFVFITKGSMTKTLGIETFQLKKNDFLFTPKHNISTIECIATDIEGFYCHFSEELLKKNPFLESLHTETNSQHYFHISQTEALNLTFLLTRMLELYKNRKSLPNDYRLLSFYLSTVIAELFLTYKSDVVPPNQHSDVLFNFKKLAYKQCKQNVSIKEYASQLNITPNHLNKLVKSETGKTASDIIKEIKILEAKVLLLQTTMTVNEISMELGFEDASYFSRFFKNGTSHSPSNYRNKIDLS